MRLKRLYLKGYANIFNAMARKEINIDFSKCTHNVVVIRSENGSGKSSIINELHPFFSSSLVWMDDTDIQKTVEFYLDDGTELHITYYGWKAVHTKQKPSKCYIQRVYPLESVELNPNGNMNSGKDIITDLLDINDDYMNLAAISANSIGIGAMKPSERKRFIALIVNSVTPFAKMYKTLVSKHSIVKSMITSLTAKLEQLGNIEVIQSNMNKAISELKILDAKKSELIQSQADIKAKMDILSINGSPIEQYKSIVNKKIALSNSSKNISEEVLNFNEEELKAYEKEQIELKTKIDSLDKILTNYVEQEKYMKSQIDEDKIKLDSLYDQSILEELVSRLNKAKEDLNIYISRFNLLGFEAYDDINENEYNMAVDAIEKFNNTISFLASQYSRDELLEASKYLSSNPDIVDCNSLISSLQTKLEEVKEKILEQTELNNQSKSYSQIPTDCTHKHDCPFVLYIVKAQESKISSVEFQNLIDKKDELIRLIEDTKVRLQKQEKLMKCIYYIRDLVNYINSMNRLIIKFPHTEKINNSSHILHCIANAISLDIDISQYREYTNYITLISALKRDILLYEEKIQTINNSTKESIIIRNSIEEKSKNLQRITEQKISYLNEMNTLKNRKITVDNLVNKGMYNRSLKLQYEQDQSVLREIDDKLTLLNKDVELYKTLETTYTKITSDLNNLNLSNIPELQKIIEQSKYQIMLYDEYVKEYNTYSELFTKIEMVKKYTSINGIQAEIMDYTMNQILSMVNQLTVMMFGGRFMLNKFEITPNDFMISFIDKELGIIRPDISMMSASQLGQLSMIISFVLLHNASQKFNIIRLDEVDNNLDNDNRLRFFDLIYTIMQILNFHQAIIISHNTELDLTNCDLIITRLQNQESYRALLNSGANVIADFNK